MNVSTNELQLSNNERSVLMCSGRSGDYLTQQKMEKENVCRTCLQIFKIDDVICLSVAEEDSRAISLRQKLQACVPELTVDIVHEPVICETCCAAIILAYQFKSSCLDNEKTLYNFIKQRKQNPYDLLSVSDLLQIVRRDINQEHSYSFVEKCSVSNDAFPDYECDGESGQLILPATIKTSFEGLVKLALADDFSNDIEPADTGKTFKTSSKRKNEEIEQSVENVDEVAQSESKEMICMDTNSTPLSTKDFKFDSSTDSENKQEVKRTRSQFKKETTSFPLCLVPENPELTTHKNNVKHKQKHYKTRRNNKPADMNTTQICNSLSESLETKENDVKIVEPNTAKVDSLIPDNITTLKKNTSKNTRRHDSETQKQISTPSERLSDSKLLENESSSIFIKSSLSECDLSVGKIDNDLKIEVQDSPKISNHRRENKHYCCKKCSKSYNYKSHFDVHLKSHIFRKLYACPICEKDFTQEKYLRTHALLHTNSGLYQCNICLKHLSSATAVKRHYRTHTGEKPYSCTACNKSFSQKIQLSVHMRTHSGIKPYTCNVCKHDFSQKSHLLGHLRIHTGEKPYKCDTCPKCFRKSYALQVHKHSHSMKPFQCRVCMYLCKDSKMFEKHKLQHLKAPTDSDSRVLTKPKSKRKILDELAQDVKDITMGVNRMKQIDKDKLKSDEYLNVCNVCNAVFTTTFSLKRHMKKMHIKDNTK